MEDTAWRDWYGSAEELAEQLRAFADTYARKTGDYPNAGVMWHAATALEQMAEKELAQ